MAYSANIETDQEFVEKTAYQLRREKAGSRGKILIGLLVLIIMMANFDQAFAAVPKNLNILAVGFNTDNVSSLLDGQERNTVKIHSVNEKQLSEQQINQSDIVVIESVQDIGILFTFSLTYPDKRFVLSGQTSQAQGLMMDNLLLTNFQVRDVTIAALAKMLMINPELTNEQLMQGLYGETDRKSVV